MDFLYDDEQDALRDAVKGLVGKAYGDYENRRRATAHKDGADDSGFDRAQGGMEGISVQAALAVGLAQLRQPCNAFGHAEASLARGLLDDLDSVGNPDVARLRDLQTRLGKLDSALITFAGIVEPTEAQRTRHDALLREQRQLVQPDR